MAFGEQAQKNKKRSNAVATGIGGMECIEASSGSGQLTGALAELGALLPVDRLRQSSRAAYRDRLNAPDVANPSSNAHAAHAGRRSAGP
jgi:hypothetical protein